MGHNDVLRLEVAMVHLFLRHIIKGIAKFTNHLHCKFLIPPELRQHLLEGDTVDPFHHDDIADFGDI